MFTKRLIVIYLVCAPFGTTGCAAYSQFVADRAELRAARSEQRANYREIERDARIDGRQFEAEQASVAALAEEACRERQREALRQQVKEGVQSKVAFNVNQALQVGQLQVDYEKLKKLLEERQKDFQERQKLVEALNEEAERQYREALEDYYREQLRSQLNEPVCGREALAEGCDVCKGCDCFPDCGNYQRGKPACEECRKKHHFFKKHKKSCEEREQLAEIPRQPLRQPLRQPILPTEIPLMLPVTLEFGMEEAGIEETRIRRQPLRELRQPLREQCDAPGDGGGQGDGQCPSGRCVPPAKQDVGDDAPPARMNWRGLLPAGPFGPPPSRPATADKTGWQFPTSPSAAQPVQYVAPLPVDPRTQANAMHLEGFALQ